jgi:hypothetical protein
MYEKRETINSCAGSSRTVALIALLPPVSHSDIRADSSQPNRGEKAFSSSRLSLESLTVAVSADASLPLQRL